MFERYEVKGWSTTALSRVLRNILLAGLVVLGTLFFVLLALAWWGSRIPKRPSDISASGIFIERGSVPFKLSTHGDWLDCWRDSLTSTNRCRLTDERGAVMFEDTFLPYAAQAPLTNTDLRIDAKKTGHLSMGVTGYDISLPIIFLQNGTILLPQTDFQRAKNIVEFWEYGHGNG
jgi:hypothetical protein